MNWDAIGAIGEIVGALAVVSTLAYLAVQIRQSSNVAQGQMEMTSSQATAEWMNGISADRELVAVWRKGVAGAPLNANEAWQYIFINAEWFYLCQGCFYQRQRGLISESAWETLCGTLVGLLEDELIGPWWDSGTASFDPTFREAIETARLDGSKWQRQQNTDLLNNIILKRAEGVADSSEQPT